MVSTKNIKKIGSDFFSMKQIHVLRSDAYFYVCITTEPIKDPPISFSCRSRTVLMLFACRLFRRHKKDVRILLLVLQPVVSRPFRFEQATQTSIPSLKRIFPLKSFSHAKAYSPARSLISGNNSTSRIDGESVNSITSRSMPIPSPPVGGMPYSNARMKSSSIS